ncbi:MAG TPA: hypothetical protein VHB27_19095 [Rhodopila sp.]|uniref:hypothetical protein n=1 Tax=Rhodopila sp. TaxID=2480087 RepID=UPI002B6A968E|nr:hypothetical protein [Rhodopila sp.]HVY17338.1 hypothetical protein [Rhodopila sp.]
MQPSRFDFDVISGPVPPRIPPSRIPPSSILTGSVPPRPAPAPTPTATPKPDVGK